SFERQKQVESVHLRQPGLHSEFQESQGYVERCCLKRQKQTNRGLERGLRSEETLLLLQRTWFGFQHPHQAVHSCLEAQLQETETSTGPAFTHTHTHTHTHVHISIYPFPDSHMISSYPVLFSASYLEIFAYIPI
ncbi:hypothetical protein LEMLEM_LOCUS22125, partial [Lemmus lemmus]